MLIPGVITRASTIEHPELIAERLERFARLVGTKRVMAGADCGFSSQTTYLSEVDPRVMWARSSTRWRPARAWPRSGCSAPQPAEREVDDGGRPAGRRRVPARARWSA